MRENNSRNINMSKAVHKASSNSNQNNREVYRPQRQQSQDARMPQRQSDVRGAGRTQANQSQRQAQQRQAPQRPQQSSSARQSNRSSQPRQQAQQPRQQQTYRQPQPRQPQQQSRPSQQSYRSANSQPQRRVSQGQNPPNPRTARQAAARKKKLAKKRFMRGLTAVLVVIALCSVGVYAFVNSLLDGGDVGAIIEDIKTPPQVSKDQMSVLVVGIDYTTEDGAAIGRDPIGMTDMILYMRFNFVDNTLRMMQIPRDLFVGEDLPTGKTGKINALYKRGSDEKNRINNLATVIHEQFQLPIDNYVSIDMESLREIVDTFGGIEIYVPQHMTYYNQVTGALEGELQEGLQVMTGSAVEFFLRNRQTFATGDIGRLDNQRYFYSALFKRVRTATWQDIVKLTPVMQQYMNTDLSLTDCAALGIRLLKIPSANIMLCRVPVFGGTQRVNGNSAVVVADKQGTADLLNQYFRDENSQIAADTYTLADWPHDSVAHSANVQWMNDLDVQGGGTEGVAADDTATGDDLLNPPEEETTA